MAEAGHLGGDLLLKALPDSHDDAGADAVQDIVRHRVSPPATAEFAVGIARRRGEDREAVATGQHSRQRLAHRQDGALIEFDRVGADPSFVELVRAAGPREVLHPVEEGDGELPDRLVRGLAAVAQLAVDLRRCQAEFRYRGPALSQRSSMSAWWTATKFSGGVSLGTSQPAELMPLGPAGPAAERTASRTSPGVPCNSTVTGS